jgi:hypothetical protein
MTDESEEQDFETPLRELEGDEPELEQRLEEQQRDNASVRSDWEGAKSDAAVPGAQEPDLLKKGYGAEGQEEAAVEHDEDEEEQERPEAEEDSDDEEEDDDDRESRGEGEPEVEDGR